MVTTDLAIKAAVIAFGYFLGAVPFGVMVSKQFGFDILASGSGNPGATNVWRTVGPKAGTIVFILDSLKGCLPAVAAYALIHAQGWAMFAGLAAVVGHTLSPFLKFKGGKGISTAFGAGLGAAPLVALSAISVFGIVLWLTRYVSVSSIVAIVSAALFGYVYRVDPVVEVALWCLAAYIIFKHRANMGRLMNGTERKYSLKSKGGSSDPISEDRA